MKNLINNKRERDAKSIVVTIGKGSDGMVYLGDTLSDRSKIKIPLDELTSRENFNSGNFPSHGENSNQEKVVEIKKEKIDVKSVKQESVVSSSNEDRNESFSAGLPAEEPPLLAKLAEKNSRQQIILPTCAQWFNFDEIHEIEMKALPEFFTGKYPSKNPEIYKEYRNFIVNLYRENMSSYLTATTCRRHLSGDACGIMRIHAFLEHWGLINFNIDPNSKPTNPLLPKVFNYKSPVFVDASSFLSKDGIPNFGNKIGDNSIILTDKQGEELRSLYPINNTPEMLFRNIFNKNSLSVLNQMSFLAKNYRPKCDICSSLCGIDWYIQAGKELVSNIPSEESVMTRLKDSVLVCESCYEKSEFPKGLTKEDFEIANFFNIVNPSEKFHGSLREKLENEKWTTEETMQLVDALEKHGENWEEIVKVFNGKRTKQDCLLHLIQLPIKDNIIFKLGEGPVPKSEKVEKIEKIENSALPKGKDDILNAINDQNNPIIAQVVFFAKMFDKFVQEDLKAKQEEKVEKVEISNSQQDSCQINQNLNSKDFSSAQELKEIIYKTYTKSIDRSKELRENEKNKMEKIMNLLVYLQMKKIEMKLSYFNDFEKLIQFETQQMKSMESQVIQDRIKLAIKKNELMSIAEKMKKEAREISISSEKAKDSSNVVNSNSNCNGSSNNLPQISEQSAIGSISFKGPILDPEPRVLALDP